MLPTKRVILRRAQTRVTRAAEPAVRRSSAPFAIEVDELAGRRVREITGYHDVEAVAPVIPLKLIEPVSLPQSSRPPSTSPAWGIRAVGADTSPFSGDGVTVAVLDTGIDASHPAFSGVELIRRNFTGES